MRSASGAPKGASGRTITPFAQQRVAHRIGVADTHEHEVRDRGSRRLAPVAPQHILEERPGVAVQLTATRDLGRVRDARQCRLLRDRGDVERPPHLPDRGDDLVGADAVADAEPARP